MAGNIIRTLMKRNVEIGGYKADIFTHMMDEYPHGLRIKVTRWAWGMCDVALIEGAHRNDDITVYWHNKVAVANLQAEIERAARIGAGVAERRFEKMIEEIKED